MTAKAALQGLWLAAKGPLGALDRVDLVGGDPVLATDFRVADAALSAIGASALAASELWLQRTGQTQAVRVEAGAAGALFRSERYFSVSGGAPPNPWSPLSGFYRTSDDRWLQLHTNFDHHRDGVLACLGCADDRAAVAGAIAQRGGAELEDELAAAGLCAALVRTAGQWAEHPQAAAVGSLPVLEVVRLGEAAPRSLPPHPEQPLSGVRVLDLTRVIAGPVAGRELAAHGAEVLHVAAAHLPSLPDLVMDVNRGKRSTFIDLRHVQGRQVLAQLASQADVFLQGFRPGALAEAGFSPHELAKGSPGIVCVEICAYSHRGPWATRRGYDTLVQSVTGIAEEHGRATGALGPRHLPVSAIDHATGYLAAFGAQIALQRRVTEGGSWLVRVSLAQSGRWLDALGRVVGGAGSVDQARADIADQLQHETSVWGELSYVGHAAQLSQTPPRWNHSAVPLGTHQPCWL